jgi:hypothetical protein
MFFLEKKNQRTFPSPAARHPTPRAFRRRIASALRDFAADVAQAPTGRSFCFFFQKEALPVFF